MPEPAPEAKAGASSGALHALELELGTKAPDGLAALDPAEMEALRAALGSARADQEQALERAMEDGLNFVPRLLRGAVKKALFG